MEPMIWKGLRLPKDVIDGIEKQAKEEQSNWCLVARRILTTTIRRQNRNATGRPGKQVA